MRLIVCDMNPWVVRAFERAFLGDQSATAFCGDIRSHMADAVATPGNSYGIMDGGIDAVFRDTFPGCESRVQAAIASHPMREVLVGEAFSVPVSGNVRFLIYAPTMRIPRPINDPYDIRLAARAVFQEAARLACDRLLMPGFGTLSGGIEFDVAAAAISAEWRAHPRIVASRPPV